MFLTIEDKTFGLLEILRYIFLGYHEDLCLVLVWLWIAFNGDGNGCYCSMCHWGNLVDRRVRLFNWTDTWRIKYGNHSDVDYVSRNVKFMVDEDCRWIPALFVHPASTLDCHEKRKEESHTSR